MHMHVYKAFTVNGYIIKSKAIYSDIYCDYNGK